MARAVTPVTNASATLANLLTEFAYEAIFRVPVSEIFPGLFRAVEAGIEERLTMLEQNLHQSNVKGRNAVPIAQKLEFLFERSDSELILCLAKMLNIC